MKITTIVVFVIMIQRIFPSQELAPTHDSFIFIHQESTFLVSKGLLCLYDKQNNTWLLVDIKISLLVLNSTSHSFAALTRGLSSCTLKEKFHILAHHVLFYIY